MGKKYGTRVITSSWTGQLDERVMKHRVHSVLVPNMNP